jgi:hypothetical protein
MTVFVARHHLNARRHILPTPEALALGIAAFQRLLLISPIENLNTRFVHMLRVPILEKRKFKPKMKI